MQFYRPIVVHPQQGVVTLLTPQYYLTDVLSNSEHFTRWRNYKKLPITFVLNFSPQLAFVNLRFVAPALSGDREGCVFPQTVL